MSPAGRLFVAVAVPLASSLVLVPLRGHVSAANLAVVLVLVVLGVAALGGRAAGVVAGVVTALAFDFFLTVPQGSFTIDRGEDITTTVLLAVVGLVGGELVERARRSHAVARRRQAELDSFQRRAELAAGGERPAAAGRRLACVADWGEFRPNGRHGRRMWRVSSRR